MEVPESTQRHTRVRLKQTGLVLFTLCDGSFVFCDVAAESSAQVVVRHQVAHEQELPVPTIPFTFTV